MDASVSGAVRTNIETRLERAFHRNNRLGFGRMQERMKQIGGTLEISSNGSASVLGTAGPWNSGSVEQRVRGTAGPWNSGSVEQRVRGTAGP
jgi:signal transduction histidine kinase